MRLCKKKKLQLLVYMFKNTNMKRIQRTAVRSDKIMVVTQSIRDACDTIT